MKKTVISLILLIFTISACQSLSINEGPCNQDLLIQILSMGIGDGNDLQWITEKLTEGNATMNGLSFSGPRWEIGERGEKGCSISLYAEINGKEALASSYYVNLDDNHLYGDDKDSQFIINNFPVGKVKIQVPSK